MMFTGFWRTGGLACLALAVGLSGQVLAQPRLSMEGGFMPDPQEIGVHVTGSLAAGDIVRGCPGWIGEAPSLILDFANPGVPLRFNVPGAGAIEPVVGLLLSAPDGIYRCAGLDAQGRAAVRVDPALAGEYLIWPALAESGADADVRIVISEFDFSVPPEPVEQVELVRDARPASGLHWLPETGEAQIQVMLAAATDADYHPSCGGRITPSRPDVVIRLDEDQPLMQLAATASVDTVLFALTPDGTELCNDDTDGLDPALRVMPAPAGDYAVWIGTFEGGAAVAATLTAGSGEASSGLRPGADPASGRHLLPADGEVEVAVTLAAATSASEFGSDCWGEIDPSRPDAVIRLDSDRSLVQLRARSSADTTLLVVGPDGAQYCNDDSDGLDPAVVLQPAAAGDYAVWVGTYGAGGATANLHAGHVAGSSRTGGFGPAAMPNPFAGRRLSSAAEALEVLMQEEGLESIFAYERLEPQGAEGFVLHGLTISDPGGATPPLRVGRLRVSDLDLDGLALAAAPSRFSISLEDIDYAALIEAGAAEMPLPPLPMLEGSPALSISTSLLPLAGDATRRLMAFDANLDGQFAFGMEAQLRWPDDPAAAADPSNIPAEAVTIEFRNFGFVGDMLRAQAAEAGLQPATLTAVMLDALAGQLPPVVPDQVRSQLLASLRSALEDPDRAGVLRLRFATDEPQGLEALFEEFENGAIDPDRLDIDISFEPLP